MIQSKALSDRLLCNYAVVEYFLAQLADQEPDKERIDSPAGNGRFPETRYMSSGVLGDTIHVDNPYLCCEVFDHVVEHIEKQFHLLDYSLPNFCFDVCFSSLPGISPSKKFNSNKSSRHRKKPIKPAAPVNQHHLVFSEIATMGRQLTLDSVHIGKGPLQSLLLVPGKALCISSMVDRKLCGFNDLWPLVSDRRVTALSKVQLLEWCQKLVSLKLGKIMYVFCYQQSLRQWVLQTDP